MRLFTSGNADFGSKSSLITFFPLKCDELKLALSWTSRVIDGKLVFGLIFFYFLILPLREPTPQMGFMDSKCTCRSLNANALQTAITIFLGWKIW